MSLHLQNQRTRHGKKGLTPLSCYNVCSETQPTAPPCTKTGTNTHTISTITVPHDPCAKICVDGVNKCGVAWGEYAPPQNSPFVVGSVMYN